MEFNETKAENGYAKQVKPDMKRAVPPDYDELVLTSAKFYASEQSTEDFALQMWHRGWDACAEQANKIVGLNEWLENRNSELAVKVIHLKEELEDDNKKWEADYNEIVDTKLALQEDLKRKCVDVDNLLESVADLRACKHTLSGSVNQLGSDYCKLKDAFDDKCASLKSYKKAFESLADEFKSKQEDWDLVKAELEKMLADYRVVLDRHLTDKVDLAFKLSAAREEAKSMKEELEKANDLGEHLAVLEGVIQNLNRLASQAGNFECAHAPVTRTFWKKAC